MMNSIVFDPLVPWIVLYSLLALSAVFVALAVWRGLSGWALRGLAAASVLAAIANPSIQNENRTPLTDIVILAVDDSSSQSMSDRPDQTAQAVAEMTARIDALDNTELRVVTLRDAEGNAGTELMSAIADALADEPRARIAGVVTVTDGQIHDALHQVDIPAPMHGLLTGRSTDWDRRLHVTDAPAFAILGEEISIKLRIDDQGAAPSAQSATIRYSVDGGALQDALVPLNEDLELPITLVHGGRNVIQFITPAQDGELTDRNNSVVVQINGVRDRLRVLLVSGEPHAGERTWRNLLKSDSSVDLVHFTILRPPEKQDGVPSNELSLIAFPTRELFLEKIDEFDLIIFDRYKRRGILPPSYIENIRRYVQDGGAVLVAAGPDYASAESLYRSALADVLPGHPTARVIEEGYRPIITELGAKHPVTEGLDSFAPDGAGGWGRWMRLIDVEATSGNVVMQGLDERPLLILDRVGEGRVALLASDHAWLWNRGFEGGGPQLELLRRLAHWMMKEPELEEDALIATSDGDTLTINRRTLSDEVGDVTVTLPDGSTQTLSLEQTRPGQFEAQLPTSDIGLYRLANEDIETVIGVGPASPREFEDTLATDTILDPITSSFGGGVLRLEDGIPAIRTVRAGRPAVGRGWIGVTPRNAFVTDTVTLRSLVPAWLFLLLSAFLIVAAWLREGRR